MSYDIIKKLKVMQNLENGKWYAEVNCASNNVYPHNYIDCKTKEFDTKEDLEKDIVSAYMDGSFQKGNNIYNKLTKLILLNDEERGELNKLDRIYMNLSKQEKEKFTAEIENNREKYTKEEYMTLHNEYFKESDIAYNNYKQAEIDLYYQKFCELRNDNKNNKIKVMVELINSSDIYVYGKYIAKTTARKCYYFTNTIENARIFTDKALLNKAERVLQNRNIEYKIVEV